MIKRAFLAKKRVAFGPSEVQILGSLIGVGLADTGIADATNLLVSTQQAFSGIDWIPVSVVAADSGATAPDSTATASTLTETTGGTPRHSLTQGLSATPSAQYTFAISAKQGLRTRIALSIVDDYAPYGSGGSPNYSIVTFDLAGGVIGLAAAAAGNYSGVSATITAQANGFYLCTITVTVNATGNFAAQFFADSGSGSGAQSLNYAGNASGAALTIWGAGVWAGAAGTYVPLNANGGAIGSTAQQAFVRNGVTTSYWGTRTPGAYLAYDAGVPVVFTRYKFAPRPSAAGQVGQWPYAPDYATTIAGAVIQTDVADSTFASPTTVNTLPAANVLPYYPRYKLHDRPFSAGLTPSRYIRLKPPSISFGGVSAWQVFALAGTAANSCPVQPVISPNGGRFPGLSTTVTITSLTTTAAIYYTLDGSTPTTGSTLYTGPFTLSVGSGSTVTVKAIAYLASLSTPTSLVTTSSPFNGYGFKPNDDEFDDKGILVEAHSGCAMWDPITAAYYRVGQFMNLNTVIHFSTTPEPNFAPAVYLYKGVPTAGDSTGLLNWTNLGPILNNIFPNQPIAGNYNLMYNALNNNYVIWTSVVDGNGNSSLYYASTAGGNIAGPWTWNVTPIVSNTFFNFAVAIDSDGVTAYCVWRNTILGTRMQQLNTSYTGFTGSPLDQTNTVLREGFAFFKWPLTSGGTWFLVTGQANPYNSSDFMDLRYTYNQGSSPLVNSWNAVPSSGADAWAGFTALGTNYNGQVFYSLLPQGKTEPFIIMDYWGEPSKRMYDSRQVWMPMVMTPTSLAIQHPASWDPSQLASTYTLNTLTLSASTFQVGAAQGTAIGTVGAYLVSQWVTLTDSHSGAVQLVGGVLQVGPTPPGSAGSFNISLTETPNLGSPRVTVISITESAVAPQLSGSVTTFTATQNINLTSLGTRDWAAFGYNTNNASVERKSGGGSLISGLTQIGAITLSQVNNAANRCWLSSWTDGATHPSVTNEGYVVYVTVTGGQGPGPGYSFTVPADTTLRTLTVYVSVSNNTLSTTQGKLVATLSDASAGPYTDTSVGTISSDSNSKLGVYTITYEAASNGQTLTVAWTNNTANGQNVQIYAATLV